MSENGRREGWIALSSGAFSGAAGVVAVMPAFYPFGRLFDPSVGGDVPYSLAHDLLLGLVLGVTVSPLAAVIGALVGWGLWRLGIHRVGWRVAAMLVALAAVLTTCLFVALNRGLRDEDGSAASFQHIVSLGTIAGIVAVTVHQVVRRVVPAR